MTTACLLLLYQYVYRAVDFVFAMTVNGERYNTVLEAFINGESSQYLVVALVILYDGITCSAVSYDGERYRYRTT